MHKKLKINQLVEISLPTGSYKGCYPSRVEGIQEDRIVLAAPLYKGMVVPLVKGDELNVSFWGQLAGYSFTTRVIETFYEDVPVIEVNIPVNIVKIQRRNYVRVPVRVALAFSISDKNKKDMLSDRFTGVKIYRTETLDLSGGGALIGTAIKLTAGILLDVEFLLPKRGSIFTCCQVVRVKEKLGVTPYYLTALAFKEIREADRNKIINYVFEIQRELRKKGLI